MQNHDHSDSKLTCIDCQDQVCPKCMVPCPVGNRCRKCVKRFQNPVTDISGLDWAKRGAAAGLAGLVLGFVQTLLNIIPWMMISCLFLGVISYYTGKLVNRINANKYNKSILPVTMICALAGYLIYLELNTGIVILFLMAGPIAWLSIVPAALACPYSLLSPLSIFIGLLVAMQQGPRLS